MMRKIILLSPILTLSLLAASCDQKMETNPTSGNANEVQEQKINANSETPTMGEVPQPIQKQKTIEVGGQQVLVEVVDTDESRTMGLSYRNNLQQGDGMLFDFTNTDMTAPGFWMKGMKFDIDIIWIYKDRVVSISKYVPAPKNENELPSYFPAGTITHVLEVPAGWSDTYKVGTSSIVKL